MAQADLIQPAWRRRPVLAAAAAALLGAALVALGIVRMGGELTRPPTAAELDRASAAEVAGRWQAWPAGRIFPAAVPYTLDVGGGESARRVGISPDIRCETAVAVRPDGCLGLLRATYLDQLQGLAVTVGVAAFPDPATAARAAGRLTGLSLHALPFPGSVAARFGDAARQTGAVRQRGPYVTLTVIGYADGRPAARTRQRQEDFFAIAPQLADAVLGPLAAPSRPACSAAGWTC